MLFLNLCLKKKKHFITSKYSFILILAKLEKKLFSLIGIIFLHLYHIHLKHNLVIFNFEHLLIVILFFPQFGQLSGYIRIPLLTSDKAYFVSNSLFIILYKI